MASWEAIYAEVAGIAANEVLDNVRADPGKLLITQLLPELVVREQTGILDLQKVRKGVPQDVKRAPGGTAGIHRGEFQVGPYYNCEERTSREDITNEEIAAMDAMSVKRIQEAAADQLDACLKNVEALGAQMFHCHDMFAAAGPTYDAAYAATVLSDPAVQVVNAAGDWDTAGGTPLADIRALKIAIANANGGIEPNTIVVPTLVGMAMTGTTEWAATMSTARDKAGDSGVSSPIQGMNVLHATETGELTDGNVYNFFPDCVVLTRAQSLTRNYRGHGLLARWRGTPDVPPPVGVQSVSLGSLDGGAQFSDISISVYPDPDPSTRKTWVQVSLGYFMPIVPYAGGLSNVTGVIYNCT